MSTLSRSDAEAALSAAGGNKAAAARALGVTRNRLRYALERPAEGEAKAEEPVTPSRRIIVENDRLREENKLLGRQLTDLRGSLLQQDDLRELILDGRAYNPNPPEWLIKLRDGKGHQPGVPTVLASDWHWAEVVDPNQIGGVNKFSVDIAGERVRTLGQTVVDLTKHYLNDPWYPGIVLACLGDMVSGSIHEELKETNELGMPKTVLSCTDALVWLIDHFAREYGRVFVPWVVGNHGRLDRKPRAKGAVTESWDWLIGMLLARHYASDERVQIVVSSSLDFRYSLYGTTFNLTHGDQFRGGGGIQGALSPWMIGDYRKRKRARSVRQDYDYLVMGHWHTLAQVFGLMVNGSLKGYDEYAYRGNFGYEVAQQALFMTHPRHGVNWWIPVKLQERPEGGDDNWLTWEA